jgi:hypothetical protein
MVTTCAKTFRPSLFALAANRRRWFISEPHAAIAYLFPQNTIFLNEIFNQLLRTLINPTDNRNN